MTQFAAIHCLHRRRQRFRTRRHRHSAVHPPLGVRRLCRTPPASCSPCPPNCCAFAVAIAPRIVIEYPLSSILMPHGPLHRFIVVSGGGGVGRARGEGDREYSFGLLCPSGWLRIKAIGIMIFCSALVSGGTTSLCTKNRLVSLYVHKIAYVPSTNTN